MSDDIIEYVVTHAGSSRRQFLVKLLAGAAFAAPVIASFAIGGASTPKRSPLDAGAVDLGSNLCDPGQTFDLGSNTCVDDGGNQTDTGGNSNDSGSGSNLPATR